MAFIKQPPSKDEYIAWRRSWVLQEYDKGKTMREIAKKLGVSKDTVFRDYEAG